MMAKNSDIMAQLAGMRKQAVADDPHDQKIVNVAAKAPDNPHDQKGESEVVATAVEAPAEPDVLPKPRRHRRTKAEMALAADTERRERTAVNLTAEAVRALGRLQRRFQDKTGPKMPSVSAIVSAAVEHADGATGEGFQSLLSVYQGILRSDRRRTQ